MRSPRGGVALTLALLMTLLLSAAPPAPAQYEDLIARVKPAVVLVQVEHVLGSRGHGSGFIYDPSGFILTNQHVVAGAKSISVVLSDGRRLPATVVDYVRHVKYACPPRVESWVDAAVLKVEAEGLPTVPLGDSASLRQGQEVLVLGFPGGVGTEEVSVTRGIVGALRPGWFQTDATMLPGNSGPVVDREGRVVGLATFGTGQLLKISGVVAINSIRRMAAAALDPNGPRAREFYVTGSEYVGPIVVGQRRVTRTTYHPGDTTNSPGSSESTTEITRLVQLAGSLLYTFKNSAGDEFENYLDADGLFRTANSMKSWRVSQQGRRTLLRFPTCPGVEWRNEWVEERVSDGATFHVTEVGKIESAEESVSVPAGTFAPALKEVDELVVVPRSARPTAFRYRITYWWAPGVGIARSVQENPQTKERWTSELVSVVAPSPTK